MKSFIVFAALVAVALARVPRRSQAHHLSLYAEPPYARAASQAAPPIALYAEPVSTPKESAPSVPALYAEPAPAASQEVPRLFNPNPVAIVKEAPSDNVGFDGYRFSFKQSDGQKREESAQVEARSNPEESILRIKGSYSYVGDDGQTYTVTYIADENGFQPQGAHLPVASVA